VDQSTDLTLQDVQSVALLRTYRQMDNTVRDFGIGMTSSLNVYIVADAQGNYDLYLAGGQKITFAPTGTTGQYDAVGSPTGFAGAVLTVGPDTFGPFVVRLVNGTVLSFGDPGYLDQLTDRYGNTITINRTAVVANGQVQNVTTPNGLWLKFTYAPCVAASPSLTCVTQVQDNAGRTVSYTYDANGRLLTVTNPAGGKTTYAWAACTSTLTCTELTSITDPAGHVTTIAYDPTTGRVTSQIDGAGKTWGFTYTLNGSGQVTVTHVTTPAGVPDDYSFDTSGHLSSVTNDVGAADAQTTTVVYDPTFHMLTSLTDPLGRTTTVSYDGQGNVASMTLLAGTAHPSTFTFTHDTLGRLTSETNALSQTTTITYNDSAHTETVTDALGKQWVVALNHEGQPVQVTDPLGNQTYLSYLYGSVVAEADPTGDVSSAYYDASNELLQSTDFLGNTTTNTWTPLGLLATKTDPLGGVTTYGYDADGNLTSVTDANTNKTTYAYDKDSRLTKKTDALGKSYTYVYDPDGNLTSTTDANGTKNTFAYNHFGRVTTAKYGVVGTTVQNKVTNTYNADNELTKAVSSATGTYKFTYDGLGDILAATSPQGTVSHTYNAQSLPTSLSAPGQSTVNYTYNADDLLTGITQGTSTASIGYSADAYATTLTLPDGIVGTTAYDADSRVTSQTYKNGGGTQVGKLQYTYTADGQIASASGSLAGSTLPAAVTNTYNADNELTTSGTTTFAYDADGNRTSNGTNTYAWNAQGELKSIAGGTTASFTYDPFGRRATSTTGGSTTSYLYDGYSVVQKLSGTTPTQNLLTGPAQIQPTTPPPNPGPDNVPGQLLQVSPVGGTASSVLTNPLGSVLALADPTGALTTNYTYSPSGSVTASGATSTNTFAFDGTQNDGTGVYSMGNRYYDPSTGTFLSQDPIGLRGGSTNFYQFASNDPLTISDPTGCCAGGHTSTWGAIIGVGIVLGVVFAAVAFPVFVAGVGIALEAGFSTGVSIAAAAIVAGGEGVAALGAGGVTVASFAAGALGTYFGGCFGLP
jgi:RHS repeat-associated protein